MTETTCKTCKFADTGRREGLNMMHGYKMDEGYARCRRYPPSLNGSSTRVHGYPTVSIMDWCGEHTPKDEAND